MFDNIPTAMEFVRSGKLRGLAVTGAGRSETLPDLPTVADFLPGYEATSWYGLGAPKGTPTEIIEKLNREVNAILQSLRPRRASSSSAPLCCPARRATSASSSPTRPRSGARW
jgi:tripartite-type tricarboxylate transporter receptor subunit TctC